MKKKTLTAALALAMAGALLAGCTGSAGSAASSAPDAAGSAATAEAAGDSDLLDKIQQAGVMIVGTEGTYCPVNICTTRKMP